MITLVDIVWWNTFEFVPFLCFFFHAANCTDEEGTVCNYSSNL